MPVVAMHHEEDPKAKIFRKAGDLSAHEVFNSEVLVGVYIRPEKTKSGLILTHKTTDEDRYQSKVGVILKMGPKAFKDPDGKWFEGDHFDVGDWIVFRASDGWALTLPINGPREDGENGLLCRLMDDVAVRMRIPGPDAVY